MSFGSRLKERREALGITQVQLAKMLGVTKGAIGNYETDANSPKATILYKVFDVLKCDANYLFQDEMRELQTDDFTVPEIKMVRKYRNLDGYGKRAVDITLDHEHTRCLEQAQRHELSEDLTPYTAGKTVSLYELPVSAGTGMLLQDEQFEFINLPPGPTTDKADFALRVSGDSMEPKFYSGDIILVQQTPSVEPNEIGVFVLNGAGYVKRLGEAGQLVSLNPAYPDIVSSDGDTLRCLGRVLGKVE